MKNSCVLLPKKSVTFKNLFCKKTDTPKLSQKLIYRKDGTTREKLIITDDITPKNLPTLNLLLCTVPAKMFLQNNIKITINNQRQ